MDNKTQIDKIIPELFKEITKTITVTKKASNPDLIPDTIKFFKLKMSPNDLKSKINEYSNEKITNKEKLETIIDRIEFIQHLEIMSKYAEKNNFKIESDEVVGINNDILALRIYLSLTCIDIFSPFNAYDKWLLDNISDWNNKVELKKFLEQKAKDYKERYAVGLGFQKAFLNASDELKSKLQANIIIKSSNKNDNSINAIASYMYKLRNKYTHEGRRFLSENNFLFNQVQQITDRDIDSIQIKAGFNIIETIIEVAIENAKRKLKLE